MKIMIKITAILIFCFGTFSTFSQTFFGTPPQSKISEAIIKKQTTHVLDIWEINKVDAENNLELYIDAVKYSAVNSSESLKAVKFTLISESNSDDNAAKTASEFEAYLDETEYPEVLVVVNQIIADIKSKETRNLMGSIIYTTKGGIKFGHIISSSKEIAFISLLYSNAEIRAEFSNAEKFYEDLKKHLEIASKDLYIPENLEKLKKVKKSNQEAKDVIIDDI